MSINNIPTRALKSAFFLIACFIIGNAPSGANAFDSKNSTLAPRNQANQNEFHERFMARASVLPNSAVGQYIKDRIIRDQDSLGKDTWRRTRVSFVDISQSRLEDRHLAGNISNNIPGFDRIKIIKIDGLFIHTLQAAHLGFIEKDEVSGNPLLEKRPVLYVDSYLFDKAGNSLLKHEIDEAIQAERFHIALANARNEELHKVSVRAWINAHMNSSDPLLNGTKYEGKNAVQIWEEMHKESYPLDELYEFIKSEEQQAYAAQIKFDYISELAEEFKDDEGNTVNVAAFSPLMDDDNIPPTLRIFYRMLKEKTARSAFGDQLVFGTSGIRDFVKFLEDIKCFAVAKAIISFMKANGYLDGDSIVIAADLRTSSPRIMETQLLAGLGWGKNILCAGNLPTPAVAYYGMYRAEGAIPSVEITASHNPVLPKADEQNGVKPNTKYGEVLKEDELAILKQVREFLELELMMRSQDSMFEPNGMLKDIRKLNEEQRILVNTALSMMGQLFETREMAGQEDIYSVARDMYYARYVDAFGKIFDETDDIAFLAHMGVGRSIIRDIFLGLGAGFHYMYENKDWEEGLIVDTEDIKRPLEKRIIRMKDDCQKNGWNIKGVFTTDGDSDRPALFHELRKKDENGIEDSGFIYGDKLGYLACEYIANLQSSQGKKKVAVVTATVSGAVIQRLKDIGYDVKVVKIGSPYVVKGMQDWLLNNEGGVAVGFERNGGFLLGSDVTLDNGNDLKALATRDAVLPIIAAFHTAKLENRTISDLFQNRFSGKYASEVWSGLVGARADEHEDADPEDVPYCLQYTATMGQAIMRSFSPRSFDICDVEFFEKEGRLFTKRLLLDGSSFTEGEESGFTKYMEDIRAKLQSYFNKERGFTGGIVKINYLDGVRMFFGNGEIVHMRPSGNSPQWRIYSEAKTIERAKEITSMRFPIYPQMIKQYLKDKEKYRSTRIKPRDNETMMKTFEWLEFYNKDNNNWVVWEMNFGSNSEHLLIEGIVFGENNSSVSFCRTTIYDVTGELTWLPKRGYTGGRTLEKRQNITWDRKNNTLTCEEKWGDGRSVSKTIDGQDAWLEIGRALDKNIPMGKLINRPFPVMSERARNYFRQEGIMWLDLFDVSIETEFTVEAPMWKHNFEFVEIEPIDLKSDSIDAVRLLEGRDHIRAKLAEGYTYEVRYDNNRLLNADLKGDNPIAILETYVKSIRMRANTEGKQGEDAVKILPFNGETNEGRALISITCKKPDGSTFGIGSVDVINLDPSAPLNIIRMANIALAASHIPRSASDDLDKYHWLVHFIKAQYKALTGLEMPADMKAWYVQIPCAKPVDADELRRYYETAVRQLREAA